MKRVAIIGAGPGGLMTAELLARRYPEACSVTLFDLAPRVGGKLRTCQFDTAPVSYESGAAECYDYRAVGEDPLQSLIAELGLDTRPMAGHVLVVDGAILGSPADIQRQVGPGTVAAIERFQRQLVQWMPKSQWHPGTWQDDHAHPWARRSCEELLDTVTDPVARKLLRMAVHSDLATEPHLTSGLNGIKNLVMDLPGYVDCRAIDGGMSALARRLTERLADTEILLNARVVRIDAPARGSYRLAFLQHRSSRQREFDAVVVALPVSALAAIEWGDERLQRAFTRHLSHYDLPGHYLRVSALFKRPFWRPLLPGSWFMVDDFGGACVYDEGQRFDAGTHGVLGWLLAGTPALTIGNLEDSEILHRVVQSLPPPLRLAAWEELLEFRIHRWAGALSGQPGGRTPCEPRLAHQPEPAAHPELYVVGDYLFDSTLNGVQQSAELTTTLLGERLAPQFDAA